MLGVNTEQLFCELLAPSCSLLSYLTLKMKFTNFHGLSSKTCFETEATQKWVSWAIGSSRFTAPFLKPSQEFWDLQCSRWPNWSVTTFHLRLSVFHLFQVTKELKNLNKKVVECTWDSETKQWKFLRVREDKSFPNGYNTAISKGQQLFSCPRSACAKQDHKIDLVFLFLPQVFVRAYSSLLQGNGSWKLLKNIALSKTATGPLRRVSRCKYHWIRRALFRNSS